MSSNTFTLGTKSVNRLGYGAMQLAGPGVFGPPRDRHVAITVLREALALGVNHIDTSDFYGPHVTNQIIREALYPYSEYEQWQRNGGGQHRRVETGLRR